ncbi:MAG: lamin tail domain-containing protein [Bacteroidales bacterium]|jgi:PKD repeat protein|nr:lamin tail domain-containing protein [Bacteroidales bacterium]
MKKYIIYSISIIVAMVAAINSVFAQYNESDIIITEILYNPPGTDSLEFIEIYNSGTVSYNLNGYKLTGPFTYTFDNITIQPGTYYVLANDSAIMRNAFGIITGQWGSGSLVNTNKMIKIVDNQQNLIDSLHYQNTLPWPAVNSSSGGPSIELNNMFTDNSDGNKWKFSTKIGVMLNNGNYLYCTPGASNTPYIPEAEFSVQNRIIPIGSNTSFQNNSFGDNLIYNWSFEGGNPGISTTQNPTITYSNYGIFDVSLNVVNEAGTNSRTKENYIGVLQTDCNIVNSFPLEEKFTSNPQCWIIQSVNGIGGWELCNNFGIDDNYSIKFDCTSLPVETTSKIITPKLDLSTLQLAYLHFNYFAEISNSSPAILKVQELSSELNIINSQDVELTNGLWSTYNSELNLGTAYIIISAINKPGNTNIYIDNFSISNSPANSVKVSGTLVDIYNKPVSNLLISAGNDSYAHTNSDGYYEIFIEKSWSGIIRAENPQYLYYPEYHQIFNIEENVENLNFEAALLPSGWIHNKTMDSHSFCILYDAFPSINEITTGSWIGIFYKDNDNIEKCCGAVVYKSPGTYCLNAWGRNLFTGDEGYSEGGEIIWKLYDASDGTIFDVAVEYSYGPNVFQNDGVSIINSFSIDVTTQTLIIPEGWSAISSYVIPNSLSLDNIFNKHLNQIVAITNDNGIYLPNNPNSTISDWDSETGWLIKTNEDIIVPFNGGSNSNLSVTFPIGWTLFPVKTDVPVQITELFADILNDIDIIKGYGYNDIYIPGISPSFELIPGKAYKARLNKESNIIFNLGGKAGSPIIYNQDENSEKNIYGSISLTSSDHVFVFNDNQALIIGDRIYAYTNNGLCVGVGEVNENKTAIFKVYGDDFITNFIDGLYENEKINFKITRDDKTYIINVQFASNTINYDYFVHDGISYVSKVKINFDGLEEYKKVINIYPNPAKDVIYIELEELQAQDNLIDTINIYDFTGRLIKTESISFKEKNKIFVGDLTNGIYIINCGNYNVSFVKE